MSLIVLSISSCGRHDEEVKGFNLLVGKEVKVDSVMNECLMAPASMVVVGDELLVANFKRDTLVDVFELPNLAYLRSGVVKGEGPDELRHANVISMLKHDYESVSMMNMTGTGVDIIDANMLKPSGKVVYHMPEGWTYVQTCCFSADGRQIMQRGELPMSWAVVDKDGNVECQIDPDVPQAISGEVSDDFSNMIIKTAHCATPHGKDVIAICYKCAPVVDFYTVAGELKCRVAADYSVGDSPQMWAIGVQPTEDLLYVNYHDPSDAEFSKSTIVAFDWDGNVNESYMVDRVVGAFAVDKKNGRIYFSSKGDSDCLYWFSVEE